ncbi:hypothetical protein [Methylomonas koyamae]|uniref:hypothetical protein n=1 Tax=Methylomonas koyamae TaxID=702114 RepID=UPI000BC2E1A3|nr:hypothetical protein [Methylomonas koyamae]ATG89704.1 hypothetical protein MKLM6_1454 [Methylomonas koyamae]
MALSALIHKPKFKPIATATVATPATDSPYSRPTVANVASVAVANPWNENRLKPGDRQKLMDYLATIGETDRESIDEYLTECGKNAANLARALQQADDCLRINSGDVSGLAQCSGCRQLSGDTCQRHGWRVVVDKWRRCSDFEVLQKTPVCELITCKACSHFQSYHPHGGGAGSCAADVQPFGACWWADTLHECSQWSRKDD